MHGDHIFGLPGFVWHSRSFQSSEEQTDLEVYGPGIKQYVMTSLRTSGTRLPYHVHFKKLMT